MKKAIALFALCLAAPAYALAQQSLRAALKHEDTGQEKKAAKPQATELSPQELFKRISRSVFVVEALDSKGSVIAFGSGVVVQGAGQEIASDSLPADLSDKHSDYLITNSHVLEGDASARVRHEDKIWVAAISKCDVDLDLCQLHVSGLDAPAVPIRLSSTLQVGERVYAVGAPEGLELTFSEGIISGLRESDGPGRIIQTTAPVSHGSSGGGLFDGDGRLLGITAFVLKEGQNLNFALPVEAIVTIEKSATRLSPAGEEGTKKPTVLADRCDSRGTGQFLADLGLGQPGVAPSESDRWVCRGLEAQGAGDDKSAIEAYRKAIESYPRNAIAHSLLAGALKKHGDSDGAIVEYREAVKVDPSSDAHYQLGQLLVDKGELDAGLAELKVDALLEPEDPYVHASLCNALNEKNDLNGAILECHKALNLKPDAALLPWLHQNYGRLLQADGDLDGAIAEFREATRLEPENSDAHYLLGSALEEKNQPALAEAEIREALRINPNYAEARLVLGNLLSGECLRDKEAILSSATGDPAALAAGYETVMNLPFPSCKQAVAESRKAVALKPDWGKAHHELAESLWWSGDSYRDEAIKEFAAACSLDPSNPKFCMDYEHNQQRWDSKRHRHR